MSIEEEWDGPYPAYRVFCTLSQISESNIKTYEKGVDRLKSLGYREDIFPMTVVKNDLDRRRVESEFYSGMVSAFASKMNEREERF